MRDQPYRNSSGGVIDRSRSLAFTFDGRAYEGYHGDTLASALLANGVHLVGRSFKYHRPRGIFGAGAEEPNALVQLGDGLASEPNLQATEVMLFDGLVARSQNRWPSARFDLAAISGLFSAFLPAGFYYKTFMWPRSGWMLYERLIRRAAGLGRAGETPDPDRYEARHAFCDVAVVGGGVTGVAVGIAAARAGAKTMVLEPRPFVGGNATTGLCLHSFLTRDRRQTVFGIAQEIVDRLVAIGAAVGHVPYDGFVSAVTPVDGDWFRIVAAEMLTEAGAQVVYGASVVGVERQDAALTGLVTAMKGGLRVVRAGSYVDTSGDADIAAFAGCPTRKGEIATGKMQPVSMLMHFHNVDTRTIAATLGEVTPAMATRPDHPEPFPVYFNGTFSRWNDVIEREGIFPNRDHKVFFNTVWPNRVNVNTSAVFGVDGTDPLAMAKAAHELTRQSVRAGNFLKEHVPGFQGSYFMPQVVAGVRESRNILGRYEITREDVLEGRTFEDTVGQICFPVDIHDPDTGQATFHQIGADGAFDIPYRALVPKDLENVLVAGRCISVTSYAHGATRNMAPCLVMGESAGVATAMAAEKNVSMPELDVGHLQDVLEERGVFLGDRGRNQNQESLSPAGRDS
jgi:hypothetical protein